jgi:membrane protease YdiL (CAAX protease family)
MGLDWTTPSRGTKVAAAGAESDGTFGYVALACGLTWGFATPAARAWMQHQAPSPFAVACAGLSAFGPLFAALAIAGSRKQLRGVFGRWRTNPAWVVGALFAPLVLHSLATALYVAIGGHPDAWFHPPATADQAAALVVFPLGEEFGWRGFAYPRMVRRHGVVVGSLVVGAVWGLWHLAYCITPGAAGFDGVELAMTMTELPLYSLVIAWVFERSNRSMAVAIAFHAGAHLDHFEPAARADVRLAGLHLGVVAAAAIVAARALVAKSVAQRAA